MYVIYIEFLFVKTVKDTLNYQHIETIKVDIKAANLKFIESKSIKNKLLD